MIAAGGTAGHVVPALAIADALRAEGAEVVFAGGERAEAQLVPAAGYELEPLRVEGISRSNPLKAARAVLRAGAARRRRAPDPRAPRRRRGAGRRRLRRRAGRARRADAAHPDRADRGRLATSASPTACSRRARGASASPSRSRAATASATSSPAAPSRPRSSDRAAARAAFGIPPDGDLRADLRRLARRALDQPRRGRGVRGRALPRPPRARRARLRRADARPARTTTCASTSTPFGQRARRRRPRRRPRRRLGVRARPVRPAGDPDPVSARLRRPPDRQRALDGRGRRRHDPRPTPS